MSERGGLRDLQRRLAAEPDNLGLRVMVAAALREAGRVDEAVALYRSVAEAYLAQGRTQQAAAVCRSVLELAPGDAASLALLRAHEPGQGVVAVRVLDRTVPVREVAPVGPHGHARMDAREAWDATAARRGAPPAPTEEPVERPSSSQLTPLPPPLPYHVAEPTQRIRLPSTPLDDTYLSAGDPRAGRTTTRDELEGVTRSSTRISVRLGAAELAVARREGSQEDLAAEMVTRQLPRLEPPGVPPPDRVGAARPRPPTQLADDDEPTRPPRRRGDSDVWLEESTEQRRREPPPLREVEDPDPAEALATPGSAVAAASASAVASVQARLADLAPAARAPVAPVARLEGLLGRLSPRARGALLASGRPVTFAAGALVLREGDAGESMFVLTGGEVVVRKRTPGGEERELAVLGRGEVLGELAVLGDRRRHATVEARAACGLLEIDRRSLADAVASQPELGEALEPVLRERVLENLMATSPLLAELPPDVRGEVLARFTPRHVGAGARVLEAGARDAGLVLVGLGTLDVLEPGGGARLARLGDGAYVGEQALLAGAGNPADVVAAGPADLFVLSPRDFHELVGDYPALWAALAVEAERRARRQAAPP